MLDRFFLGGGEHSLHFGHAKGFLQQAVETEFGGGVIAHIAAAGHQDNAGGGREAAELTAKFEAGHVGHLQIGEHEFNRAGGCLDGAEGGGGAGERHRPDVQELLDQVAGQGENLPVVIHDEPATGLF